MSTLAQQLQRLAVPQTANLTLHDKERKSLLFDPKEAANLDKETFFALGINGLEELSAIQPTFRHFESSLFNENSQNFQRSVQTKEVNDRLDETISEYLLHLSPYFLLKPAHKTLEWLIYRYQIHLYNADSLMLCILPYHESKIFVRALQLLKLDSKTKTMWDWLLPIQESGVYLPRTTLINHCGTNPAFLSFISEMIPKYIQVHTTVDGEVMSKQLRVIFSFYATTIVGVLEMRPITEKIVSGLIPYLTRGLKSSVVEYKAASYMIIGQLLYKTQLKEKLLTTLLNTISKYLISSFLTEGVLCILIMFQTQENINKLSKKSFKYLSRQNRLVPILDQLSSTHNIDSFIKPFLLRLIKAGVKQATTGVVTMDTSEDESSPEAPVFLVIVREVMSRLTLNEEIATEMSSTILHSYIEHGSDLDPNDPSGESLNLNMKTIVSSLETRYPSALDTAIAEIRNRVDGTDEQEAVDHFLRQSVVSVKRQIIPDMDSNLFLCLNHRSEMVRIRAVQHLLRNRDQCEDVNFVSESLLARMVDDSKNVVKTVFKNCHNLYDVIVDKKELQNCLIHVLKTQRDKDLQREAIKTLALLDSCYTELSGPVLMSYLCCLDKQDNSLEFLEQLLKSPLAESYLPLSDLKTKYVSGLKKSKHISCVALNIQLVDIVGETVISSKENFVNVMKSMHDQVDNSPWPNRLSFMVYLILLRLIESKRDVSIVTRASLLIVELLEKDMKKQTEQSETSIMTWTSLEDIVKNSVSCLVENGSLSWSFYTSLLTLLVDHVTIPVYFNKVEFWQFSNNNSVEDDWLKLVIKLLDTLLELAANSKINGQGQKLVMAFIQNKFPSPEFRFKLFGLIWTEHLNNYNQELGLTTTLQARVMQLGQIYLKSVQTLNSPLPVIVNLLTVCTSKHSKLREVAVGCLNIIVHILPDSASPIRHFIRNLLNREEEIVNDQSYLNECFRSICDKKEKSSPKKRRSSSESDKHFLGLLLEVGIRQTTPAYITRSILDMTSAVDNLECFYATIPLLEQYLSEKDASATVVEMDCLSLLFKKYTTIIASSLSEKSKELKLLVKALTMSKRMNKYPSSVQVLAISQITRDFYDELPTLDSKYFVFNSLTTAWLNSTNILISNMVKRVFKHVTLDAENIIKEMLPVLQTSNANTVREAKKLKRQTVEVENVSVFDSDDWKRVLIILEAIQEKKKIENSTKMVPIAFTLLARILEAEDHTSAEYIKQLVLSTLYFISSRHQEEIIESGLKPEQFNLEQIVQCIRTSDNPQTHHQALLVLTTAAKIQPEQLLHNVMSVFTFMGANILRQDNAYSFHVISQILEKVIPVITMACEEKSKCTKSVSKVANPPELIIGMILRVFVDAYPHIPEHRKLMLFSKLINIVGEHKYLWHCLLLFIEHVATKGRKPVDTDEVEDSKQTGPVSTNDLEFILKLATSFPVVTQLMSARTMIGYVASLPVDKDDEPVKSRVVRTKYTTDVISDEAKIFSISTHTAKQLRHFKYATLYVLCQQLQFDPFLAQISAHGEEELLHHFQKLLESVLHYLSQAAKTSNQCQNKPDTRFHKVLLHKVYDLLDKIVSLLPDAMFVQVVSGLMDHDLPSVQRKSMELLNTKLHQLKENQTITQMEMLLPLVDKLCNVAKITLINEVDEETAVNGQTALYSLKLLCRMLGTKNPKTFIEVLKLSSKVLHERRESASVCASVLLCIAELCSCLKVHVIQHLPLFVPQIIQMVAQNDQLIENELLTLSFATALLCVVESLPQFLSPYLLHILEQVCRLSYFADGDNPQRPQLKIRLQLVRQLLATSLPTRVVFPCITSCYDKLVDSDWECLVFLMSILKEHINQMKKEDLDSYQNQLRQFFFTSLDFRINYTEKIDKSGIIMIEDSVIETITGMVMKMSEASFRPMMFKIFDWATRDGVKDRILILYRLSNYLVETLRSLFIMVAGPIVNYTAEILDANNSSKTEEPYFGKGKLNRHKEKMLLSAVIGCLSKCFLYDNEGFVTAERFETVMQAIVDQIDNLPFKGSEKTFKSRITNCVVPCIANLAVAAHDDSLWRKLNYQILLKTRHSSEVVRLAALEVEDEFHKKLGDDFMSLLPETIPFLAELMEDESDEVEKKCHRVIIEMEKTLGEPLQKYF